MDYNKQIIELTLEMLLKHIKAEQKKTGADLTIPQIEEITSKCKRMLQKEFAFAKPKATQSDSKKIEYDEFEKTIIKRIENILVEKDDPEEIYFSRKGLKGLFVAFDRMTGPDIIEKTRQEIYVKLDRLVNVEKMEEGDALVHSDVQGICNDFFLKILPHFDRFDHRVKWFRGVIDINFNESREEGNPQWQCREQELILLLKALFKPLFDKTYDDFNYFKKLDPDLADFFNSFAKKLEGNKVAAE